MICFFRSTAVFVLTVFLAVIMTVDVVTAAPGGNLAFTKGKYNITVTGNQNVPKYTFTSTDYVNTTYKIMYQKIYETDINGNKVGKSISLPSLNWAITEDAVDPNVFWIKSEGFSGAGKTVPWSKLEFKNNMTADKVKFDVILNGYQWSDPNAAALNIAWKFTENSASEPVEGQPGLVPDAAADAPTQKCFGNGIMCFDIADKANITDSATGAFVEEIDVALTFDGTEGVTVTYKKRFTGDLYHDPSFGFTADDTDSCDGILGALLCFFTSIIGTIFFCF